MRNAILIRLLPHNFYQNGSRNVKRIQRAYHRETALPVVLDEKLKKRISRAEAIIFSLLFSNSPSTYIKQVKSLAQNIVPILLAPRRKIIDSVGAGDVFEAAFIYWYAKTKKTQEEHYQNLKLKC